jgi:hypothetical protein
MSTIIAARFNTRSEVDQAVTELKAAGFAEKDIHVFYVTPPGQHHVLPAGGDEIADESAKNASRNALKGAAAGAGVGALVGAVGGPLGAGLGAGVGAYTGSMVGAMTGMKDDPARKHVPPGEQAPIRLAGEHVAVRVSSQNDQARAIDILHAHHGQHVELAEGTWRDGAWVDFDPLAAPVITPRKPPGSSA